MSENYSVRDLSDKQATFTPKIGIDVRATENLLGYASYTFGQKSGGYNRAAGTLAVASYAVAPEKVRTAEVGLKTQFLEKRLTFNVAAFHNDFRDYQAQVANPIIDGRPVNGTVVVNAGRATLYGVELEASVRPVKDLQLRAHASILRTRFDEFANPTGAESSDFTGNEVPNAPRLTAFGGFNYVLPEFGVPGNIQLNGSVSYIKRPYTNIQNNEALRGDNRTWVVAGIDYLSPERHWTLSLQVKNLLDRDFLVAKERQPAGTDTSR